MFCSKCGKQIPEDSTFCNGCGKPAQEQRPKARGRGGFILLLAGLLAAATLILAVVIVNRPGDAAVPAEAQPGHAGYLPASQPLPILPPQPVLRKHSVPLYSGFVSVPAKNVTWKCFGIGGNQEDPKIAGRFQAAGGSGNDIQMVVASEDEFNTWRTIHSGTLLYDSGKMTATGVEVAMPGQGRYCAGFSNGFSAFSAKSVNATINLEFSSWEVPK